MAIDRKTDKTKLQQRLYRKHHSVEVKLAPFHKYDILLETNELAHEAIVQLRKHK